MFLHDLTQEEGAALGRLAEEKERGLRSLLDSLDVYGANAPVAPPSGAEPDRTAIDRLFLVHGRDKGAREEVHRFLERVTDLKVIVLAEQPLRGQTIIEKLEAEVPTSAYVVVVMTADDEGRLQGESGLNPRARQNVVFELGMATGRVGRGNVAVLYEDGIELPSDYYGVEYLPFDAGGGWKLKLVAALKAVGIDADANRAIG